MKEITFTEDQKMSRNHFTRFGLFLTVLFAGLLIWGFIQQIILGKPFGSHPQSDSGFLITNMIIFIFIMFLVWLLLKVHLITEINQEFIRYRFYPFISKDRFIYWKEVKRAYVRQYKPLKEYGGWGIRYGIRGNGKALNVKGKFGLQLELKSGKKLLIGTQNPEELEAFLISTGKNQK